MHLAGIAVVGLKWWHDKQRLDKAKATNQRLGSGSTKGWLAWLNTFGAPRRTIKCGGKAGKQSDEPDHSAGSKQVETSPAPTQPYDKASLLQFLDGRWTVVSRNAKVHFITCNEGLEALTITSTSSTIVAPVSSELQLRGSASDQQVKFTADGCFCSLKFATRGAYQAFYDAFLLKLQQNKPMLLQRAQIKATSEGSATT